MEWSASPDEYEKLVIWMNTPRVVIDNTVCATATLVKVNSARKDVILLEAVQVLTDLDLSIRKAHISSDGCWFMNVFHVTDRYGHKVTDEHVIAYIERSLSTEDGESAAGSRDLKPFTTLELVGNDRPGLISEIFAVLANLSCSVLEAKLWAHKGRVAGLLFVAEEDSGSPIGDSNKIRQIEARLRYVLRGAATALSSSSAFSTAGTTADRRIHQLMFADRDHERAATSGEPSVSVQNLAERGYSIVNVQCIDRPKLLFDVLCTLTDMEYVVFHGTIYTPCDHACLEFYIRHSDGSPICSEAERQRVIQCLQAAIERRASEGLRLELCTADPVTLAEATRTFRENGLTVTRAEMSTKGEAAANVFYVTDAGGDLPGQKTIKAVMERIGGDSLKACEDRPLTTGQTKSGSDQNEPAAAGCVVLRLGSLVMQNLSNLGLIVEKLLHVYSTRRATCARAKKY